MTPLTLEGNMNTLLGNNVTQNGSKSGSIPLSMLIEFIIQRTYHELEVMTELLPRMSDREKKIQIYNYADRTRLLFIRLLALVKWANSASKVDKSNRTMSFLEKQSMLFIDTADLLARISRETVVRARLPNFHMPSAIEILTTGTYARIPACVKRIVPNEPILPSERRTVLLKLNQVIQHRLVASNLLPQMRNLKIANGRVTFHVENEFDVSLTVMGDAPNVPWRLLDIKILVNDRETGGKKLVHSLQNQYLLSVLQCRIAVSNDPLKEVYVFLHYFCQSLQLEVYYTQAYKLFRGRLEGHINIEEYTNGHSLSVSYWRELTAKDSKSELGYTVTLLVDTQGTGKPLNIVHVPSLGINTIPEDAPALLSEQHLCMERLLVYTIHLRSRTRLTELMKEMKTKVKGIECDLRGTPAVLSLSVLVPCLQTEQLIITIDIHTGMIQCNIGESVQGYLREGYRCQQFLLELQNSLNTDRTNIPSLIMDMRYWLTKQRCIKTLQHLPVTVSEQLPLMIKADLQIPLKKRMFVSFHKYRHHVLVVEMKEKDNDTGAIDYNFHIINVKRMSIDEGSNSTNNTNNESSSTENEISRLYLKVLNRMQFDPFVITHGPFTSVLDISQNKNARPKRKSDKNEESLNKKSKYSEYFIPELAHVVALCNEITPFSELAQEFTKRGIPHQGIQVEANATALSLKLVELPVPDGVPINSVGWSGIKKSLLSVSIRSITHESGRSWAVEYVMNGTPIPSTNSREQGMRRPVYFQYNMNDSETLSNLVNSFLRDWSKIVHLYCLIKDMREYYPFDKFNYSAIASVKSYNYSELVINYGATLKQATATFHWNADKKAFTILFGSMGALPNAHSIMKEQLEDYLNKHQDLAQIIHILHETYHPLMSINKLPSTPQLNIVPNRPLSPILNIATIAQSPFVVRVVYQGTFCLEINLCSDGLVSIRDAACSKFDRSIAVSEYVPTGGLKAFLSRYEDERSILRRRSHSEDDNPPSPIRNDSIDSPSGFLSHHRGPQSPGKRFHTPMTPPSNPHTPASPHPGSVQQPNQSHQTFSSTSAATFNMASPPSLSSANINPSPSTMPHPSPGSNFLASSPSNPSIHVPSPMTNSPGPNVPVGHSPAGAFLTQGHNESSPFPSQSMASPGAANWPSSPMPRPSPARPGQSPGGYPALHSPEQMKSVTQSSRVLPQKQWAGAVPTLLSHEALDVLCTPSPHPQLMVNCELSPLERFLGCVSLKRHMQRALQGDDSSTIMKNVTTENGQLNFKTDSSLQCLVSMNIDHFQSLHIKVGNSPEINKDIWTDQDLRILEQFFDCRVATPPYKSPAVYTFCKMLQCNPAILKDFIQIMKLDLTKAQTIQQQQQTVALNWNVQICLTSSLCAIPQSPTAFYISKNKILFYLKDEFKYVNLFLHSIPNFLISSSHFTLTYWLFHTTTTCLHIEM